MDIKPELSEKYLSVKDQIQKLDKQLQKLIKKQHDILDVMERVKQDCTHEEMIESEDYYPGSYYDLAVTTYWSKCVCCGYTKKIKTVTHSWYG